MSTLYIRMPSKAAADAAENWIELACPYAWVSGGGAIEREGATALSRLGEYVSKASRVVLLLAASDVSLLRVQVPPMSAARLKAALPNLVEEHLISDPSECVMMPGAELDGLRTVAVVQRAWLEAVVRTLSSLGAHQMAALPAQLCVPAQEDAVAAAVTDQGADIDLALRLGQQEGLGLPILVEQGQDAAQEVLQALRALVPNAAVTLYVPQAEVPSYQSAAATEDMEQRVAVYADNWSRWLDGARGAAPDLLAGTGGARGPSLDWRRWRWPLVLGGLVLLINVIGLNVEWLRMRGEAGALRASMTQIYKNAYPKDTVIVDPIAQMRQKIAAAKHNSGQAAPDDFTMLTAAFGEAWQAVVPGQPPGARAPAIAGLEYKDRSLLVRLKPDTEAPTDRMKMALASRDLSLALAPAQQGAVVWQIRSVK